MLNNRLIIVSFSTNIINEPTIANNNNNNNSNKPIIKVQTGAFKLKLPDIFVPATHYKRALKNLKDVVLDPKIQNARNQNRKFTAQTFDALMKGLTIPLTKVLLAYKKTFKELHPFEATVAELTIAARIKLGHPHVDDILIKIKELNIYTSKLAKEYASKGKNASTSQLAKEILLEGMEKIEDIYKQDGINNTLISSALIDLVNIQKELRKIPVIELNTPTVVLVGSPNVGKSTIVRAVSSGTPEVNDYPFTTRGVTIGHIIDSEKIDRFQVMDTPGLLDRGECERNEMEKLTYASMLYLPTGVIFVIDPSGNIYCFIYIILNIIYLYYLFYDIGLSGDQSTLEAQLNVRSVLKAKFPKRPWLDVVSKGDLEIPQSTLDKLPCGYLLISVHSGLNMDILHNNVMNMLNFLKNKISNESNIKDANIQYDNRCNLNKL
jgi:nucleolar GTP-binding protein